MSSTTVAPNCLAGARIVLVGRFAALRRSELERRVAAADGSLVREVTATATMVVIGGRGWPLRKNGRLPRTLLVARILLARQAMPLVFDERTFLRRFAAELSDSGSQIEPIAHDADDDQSESASLIPYQDLSRARILADCLMAGVPIRRLQRALRQLSRWCPEARQAWEGLLPQWDGQLLQVRLPDGRLVEPRGQRLLDFSPEEFGGPLCVPFPSLQADLFDDAVRAEQRGDLRAAEDAYRRLLLTEGPDADVDFNLANVLVAQGDRRGALERLWACVELAPNFAEAWHNLGTVALKLRLHEIAERGFRRAIELIPGFDAAAAGLEFLQSRRLSR